MALYTNGGLIGVTNTATSTVASGIWTRNDQHLSKRAGNWPTYAEPEPTDPYWSNVSFYGKFDTTWTDYSNNNFTVTNVSGTYSPQIDTGVYKFGGGSAYYQKGAAYNTTPYSYLPSGQSAFATGTGDYTVECWIYVPAQFSGNVGIFCLNDYQSMPALLGLTNANASNFGLAWYDGTSFTGSTTTMNYNAWHHVAGIRASGQIYYGINGVIESKYATSKNHTNTSSPQIHNSPWDERFYSLYVDEIRVTKGVARYTGSTYTVPTGQFPTSA